MKTKSIIALLLAIFSVALIHAQQNDEEMKLLFNKKDKPGHEKIANGGYGSFSVGWTQINKKGTAFFGARAAWIANHHFALGLGGSAFLSDFNGNQSNNPKDYFLAGGYGGLLFEPIVAPMSPVHVSFPIILGVGGVAANPVNGWDNYNYNYYYYDTDVYFVFEPGVDLEFNIVKFFRVALGASYRFTNGVNLQYKYLDEFGSEQVINIDKNALDSFTFDISFKFGWF